MDEERRRELSLPLNMKPFRLRTLEAWASFWQGEEKLRALLNRKDRGDVGEELVETCSALLAPAFSAPAFELGHNGEKYELILSPEGDRVRLFQLAYFQRHAPRELLETWNIIVGRTRSERFGLRMFGQDVALKDIQAWPEQRENGVLNLALYCEKLAGCPREEAHYVMCILLDQALGELAAMRYVDRLDLLDAPRAEEGIPLDRLAGYVAGLDPEGWERSSDPEAACERCTAYQGEPSREEDWALRQDVFAGSSCCVPLIQAYLQGDDYYMDRLHADGAAPGFLYYALEDIDRKDVLDLRDRLEEKILEQAGADAVTFTGGATGVVYGYLDFIAWDLKEVLDAAAAVFAAEPVKEAAFHTFRRDSWGIRLK